MIIRDRKRMPAKVSSAIQLGFALLGAAIVGALMAGMITFAVVDARYREEERSWTMDWACSEEKRSLEGIETDLRDEVADAAIPKHEPVLSEKNPAPTPVDPRQVPTLDYTQPPSWMLRANRLDDYELTLGLTTDSRVLRSYVATLVRLQSYCPVNAPALTTKVWGDAQITDLTESKLTEFAVEVSHVRRS